MLDVTDSQAVV